MRLGAVPETLVERIAITSGMLPPGIIESWMGMMASRTIMSATQLNFFEALADGPLSAAEVAATCDTHPRATEKLLNALVGMGCLIVRQNRYRMRKSAAAWFLKRGSRSFRDQILLHYLEWNWWEHCEEYVRTGRPLRVHQNLNDAQWGIYQRGMRSGIAMPAHWVARQLPLSEGAAEMLDIGGGHGYFSVAICRRHPAMHSTILELPEAISHAAPILAAEKMGDRVMHRAGDALKEDLGQSTYDLVFMAAIVHHFTAEQNRLLLQRIARALRPGGIVAIWEPLRQQTSGRVRQFGALLDLFFGLFSEAGTWSAAEISEWYRDAGLRPLKPRISRLMPDLALHIGRK